MDEQTNTELAAASLEAEDATADEAALGDAVKGTDDGVIGQNIDL